MAWIDGINGPAVIAGPCSAESEEQMHTTAAALASSPLIKVFRAGIWKPRTRPNSFEGIGTTALPWLVDAGKAHGLKTATEVANSQHVEHCLKAGVDMLWVGARTTVSPFAVQEIVDALKGSTVPIMVKNPINADINLWIGAIERFLNAGFKDVSAIHRGFSFYGESVFRNLPRWEIPIELKRLKPDLPLFCDPSHIAGKRNLIGEVCQKALDLNFQGLMIESHPAPEKALSDSEQQLVPNDLLALLNQLTIRSDQPINPAFLETLHTCREHIDRIDDGILDLFVERMAVAETLGAFKRDHDVTILKLRRWDQMLRKRLALAEQKGLSSEFVNRIMELLHKESIRIQNEIMNR